MGNGSGPGETWVQLIREIVASGALVRRTVVLLLACTPAAATVALVFLVAR